MQTVLLSAQSPHYVGRSAVGKELALHEIHCRSDMIEELPIPSAEVVQSGLSIGSAGKTVFGAFAVAGKKILTLKALPGQRLVLRVAEILFLSAVHHLHKGLLTNVAEPVFRKDEMVAGVDIAVVLHHTGMAARTCHRANARRHPHPIGERGVKKLDIILSYVVHYPFIEDGTKEITPFLRSYRERSEREVFAVRGTCEMAPVRMRHDALYNRSELKIMAIYALEKPIELMRAVHIQVVDYSQRVPFHAVAVKEFDAGHDLGKGAAATDIVAVAVVDAFRTVNRDPYKPSVVPEELAPFGIKQRGVGLYAVVNLTTAAILFL